MAANSLRMSEAETIKFLECYKAERELWDPSMEDYKRRGSRAAASKRIATALGLNGFTEMHVTLKFKNLRSSYLQELKKIADSKAAGCTNDAVYVPKVRWFKLMDSFLRPYVKSIKSKKIAWNMDDVEAQFCTSSEAETSDVNPLDYLAIDQRTPPNEDLIKNEKRPLDESKTMPIRKKTKNEYGFGVPLSSRNSETFCNKQEMFTKVSSEDKFDCFGKYVASLLRDVSPQKSKELQRDIIIMVLNVDHNN